MDVFKTKPGIPESLHILEETFTNATNKQVPYYTEGEHGRNARCFAVCPLCDNPIQIIGLYKAHDEGRKPYGRHYPKDILDLANYDEEEIGEGDVRTVLHFHPALAPVKIGILPLSKKLNEGAEKIYEQLSRKYNCEFDDRGNIGKRYRRQDEIGTPFCITYDFDSETDNCVTVRFRDSMEQERVAIADLDAYFADKFTF